MARIVHIAKHYPPTPGGIERITKAYAEGMADAGHDVQVITLATDGQDTLEQLQPNLRVMRIAPSVAYQSGHFSWTYLSKIRCIADSADIVHVHEPNPLATLGMALTSFRGGVVVSWHSDIIRQKLFLPLLKPLQHRLLARADAICVLTKSLVQNSYALPRYHDKCHVLPTGVDTAPFAAVALDLAAQERVRQQAGGRFILATGRMASYKGFDILLRALATTNLRAVIAGDGPQKAMLLELRNQLGLAERVWFPGAVSDADLQGLYAACDVFVLPSISSAETFGLVQLEAMACAKPVINTALETGVPEVSLHNITGLTVQPGDIPALADAMVRLMEDEAFRETMGNAALARVNSQYSTKAALSALELIYQHCLQKRFASAPLPTSVGL